MLSKTWFRDWFDTPYYHKLYAHRNFDEAKRFMEHLIAFLKLPKGSAVLDIPCGRGRHAVFLNELGYEVTGIDLSRQNIGFAKQFEKENLRFVVGDMRKHLSGSYDAVFNLFTSFGYFSDDENVEVLKNFKSGLNPGGVLVIDFLNISKVCEHLVPEEYIFADGINFHIRRKIDEGFLIKEIDFTDKGNDYHFEERVRCLDVETFKRMIAVAGMQIDAVFGDYNLGKFDASESERLILIVK